MMIRRVLFRGLTPINGSEDDVHTRTRAYALRLTFFLILAVVTALPAEAERRPKRIGPAFLDSQVLVGFQPGTPASARSDAHHQAGGQVQKNLDPIGVELVAVAAGTVSQSIAAYQRNPNVRFAEPNYVRVMILPVEGKDPPPPFGTGIDYLKEQWGLNNTGQSFSYDPLTGALGAITGAADADIDAPGGWDLSKGDASIKIAILDAGVDCLHVDLKNKCVEQLLVTSQSTTLDDVIGHGTHVAAIAAAETNNSKGTAGVGWNSTFGSLKVCYEYDDPLFGLVGLCDTAASASAMIYAADHGYKVINMSYAGPDFSQTEANAAKYAWDHGVVPVAAAANDYARTPMYPAAYPEVIAVAATDWYDNLAGFSNFGNNWVSVAAPGDIIFSAFPNAACGIPANDPYGCYAWLSGTSMASPHVAGAAALVWAKLGSGATPQQVRAAIENGADRTGALGQNFLAWTQHGRLNVYGALSGAGQPPPLNQTITFGTLANKTLLQSPFTVSATASSALPVTFSVTTPAVCSSGGTNGATIALLAAGTCTVRADQAGNASYNPAPSVSQSFIVSKASQTITFGTLANKTLIQSPFTINATGTSGLPVTFAALTPAVCTASGTSPATVTLLATGTCTVSATQAGNAIYNPAPAVNRSFTVSKANQTISFAALAAKTMAQSPVIVVATASSGLTVLFNSTTPSICTSGGTNGATITLLGPGTCTVRATQSGDSVYNAAPAVTRSFTVSKVAQTITFAALANKTLADSPVTVSATATSGLPVTFSTSTPVVCTAGGTNGKTITLLAPGTCTVRASQAGDTIYGPAPVVSRSFLVT
jgi:thermitase